MTIRIKICGITRYEDAKVAAGLGVEHHRLEVARQLVDDLRALGRERVRAREDRRGDAVQALLVGVVGGVEERVRIGRRLGSLGAVVGDRLRADPAGDVGEQLQRRAPALVGEGAGMLEHVAEGLEGALGITLGEQRAGLLAGGVEVDGSGHGDRILATGG